MKFAKLGLAFLGLLWALAAVPAHAAFVDVGSPYRIVNGAAPGGSLAIGNVEFFNFQVTVNPPGLVPTMPRDIDVQAKVDGNQLMLYFTPMNFALNAFESLNATLNFQIRVNGTVPPGSGINSAAMSLLGVTTFGNATVEIGESVQFPQNNVLAFLDVIKGQGIPTALAMDSANFAHQSSLFITKDIYIQGGTNVGDFGFSRAHLSGFSQVYTLDGTSVTIPEPGVAGLAILSCLGSGWWLRRRTTTDVV